MRGLKGGALVGVGESMCVCVRVGLFSCPGEKGEHLLAASIMALSIIQKKRT